MPSGQARPRRTRLGSCGVEVDVDARLSSTLRIRNCRDRGKELTSRIRAGELNDALALTRHESVDVDERLDVGIAGGGVGDHGGAVGMPHEDNGSGDRLQDTGDVCRVSGKAAQTSWAISYRDDWSGKADVIVSR